MNLKACKAASSQLQAASFRLQLLEDWGSDVQSAVAIAPRSPMQADCLVENDNQGIREIPQDTIVLKMRRMIFQESEKLYS